MSRIPCGISRPLSHLRTMIRRCDLPIQPGGRNDGRFRMQLGIIGAGRVGTAIARQALAAGVDVRIAASGEPSKIELIASVLMPGVRTVTATDAALRSDLVIVAVPLNRMNTLPFDAFTGKVVIDAMNYWAP